MVGVLVQTQVRDEGAILTELGAKRPDAALGDAVRVGCLAPQGILPRGDPEQDEPDDPLGRDLARLLREGLEGVLRLARHRRDGLWLGDALLHEQGSDQVTRRKIGLANERPQGLGAPQPSRPLGWERHVIAP